MAYTGIKCVSAPTQSNAKHQININMAVALGATHYRYAYEIGWGDALPSVAAMVRAAGLKMVLCVFRQDRYMPATAATQLAFANSVKALVAKATDIITHVEVWNEPNITPFCKNINPLFWGQTVVATSTAVKATYPTVKIITGGLSPAGGMNKPDVYFMEPIKKVGGFSTSFDYIGWHPYCFPSNPLSNVSWNPLYQALALKNVLHTKYPARTFSFAATEYGAPSKWSSTALGTPVVFDDAKQAKWYKDYFTFFATKGVTWGLISPFTLRDQAPGVTGYTGTTWEPTVGFYRYGTNDATPGTAKPAAAVYTAGE